MEKKATALLQGAKVLMPKMPATHSGGFIHSLTGKDSSVKAENENITESRRRMISPTKKQTLHRLRQRRTLKARPSSLLLKTVYAASAKMSRNSVLAFLRVGEG